MWEYVLISAGFVLFVIEIFDLINVTRLFSKRATYKVELGQHVKITRYGWIGKYRGRGYICPVTKTFYSSGHVVKNAKFLIDGKIVRFLDIGDDIAVVGKGGVTKVTLGETIYWHYVERNQLVIVPLVLEEFEGHNVVNVVGIKGRSGSVFMNKYRQVVGVYGCSIGRKSDKELMIVGHTDKAEVEKIDVSILVDESDFFNERAKCEVVDHERNDNVPVKDIFFKRGMKGVELLIKTGGRKSMVINHFMASNKGKYVLVVPNVVLAQQVLVNINRDLKCYEINEMLGREVSLLTFGNQKKKTDIIILVVKSCFYWIEALKLWDYDFFFDEWDTYSQVVERIIPDLGGHYCKVTATGKYKNITMAINECSDKTIEFEVEYNNSLFDGVKRGLIFVPSKEYGIKKGVKFPYVDELDNSRDGVFMVSEKNRRGVNYNPEVVYDFGSVIRFKYTHRVDIIRSNIDVPLFVQTVGRLKRFERDGIKEWKYMTKLRQSEVLSELPNESVEQANVIDRYMVSTNLNLIKGNIPYASILRMCDADGKVYKGFEFILNGRVSPYEGKVFSFMGQNSCYSNADIYLENIDDDAEFFDIKDGEVKFFVKLIKPFHLVGWLFAGVGTIETTYVERDFEA